VGYDLHVTRKEYWSDDDGPVISLEEWQTYVTNDPEIEPDSENPGPENYVIVTHPQRWSIWWDETGELYSKNPDRVVIAKLVQIAAALGARVLGDDEEIYGVDPADPSIAAPR